MKKALVLFLVFAQLFGIVAFAVPQITTTLESASQEMDAVAIADVEEDIGEDVLDYDSQEDLISSLLEIKPSGKENSSKLTYYFEKIELSNQSDKEAETEDKELILADWSHKEYSTDVVDDNQQNGQLLASVYYYSDFSEVPDFGRNLNVPLYDSLVESDSGIYYYNPSSSDWADAYDLLLMSCGFSYEGYADLDSGGLMLIYSKAGYDVGFGVDYVANRELVFIFIKKTDPVTLTLNHQSLELALGKSVTLKATRKPADRKDVVSWYSEDESIATVSSKGTVKAKGVGNTTIYALTQSGLEACCEVSVFAPVTRLKMTSTKAAMVVGGDVLELSAVATPENHTDTITWSSSNEDIATVDENGVVTALATGKAKITAASGSGKKATCNISIGVPADTVEFSALKSTSLAVGKTLTLKAKAYRKDGTKPISTAVIYEIVDGNDLATIDAKGKLKAISTGSVTVRATAEATLNGAFADITINICNPIKSIKFAQSKITVSENSGTTNIFPSVSPDNHTDTITFTSSNVSVVTVDGYGNINPISAGTAKITAVSGSGKKAMCTVKVEKAEIEPAALAQIVLEDVSYTFETDSDIIGSNPGAVGGGRISATVTGPANVKAVMIATWGENISNWSETKIAEQANWYASIWKNAGIYIDERAEVPYTMGNMHPIDEEELDKDLEVLLIGLDENCNAVGYAIVKKNP